MNSYSSHIPNGEYRLLFFRYFVFVSAGIWLACYKVKMWWMILSTCVGALYIYYSFYTSYRIPFFALWRETSFPTVFYAIALVHFTLYLKRFIPDFKSMV